MRLIACVCVCTCMRTRRHACTCMYICQIGMKVKMVYSRKMFWYYYYYYHHYHHGITIIIIIMHWLLKVCFNRNLPFPYQFFNVYLVKFCFWAIQHEGMCISCNKKFFLSWKNFFLTVYPLEHLDLFKKVVLESGFCPSAENWLDWNILRT